MSFVERLLIGDGPWTFLVEIVARAVVVYALLLSSMRLMGKRVAAQLSITELAVVLMLGAAVGGPIQVSSQGVVPAAVVLFSVVALQRMTGKAGLRWRRFEVLQQGDVTVLIKDGRMLVEELKGEMSRDMLASQLRGAQWRTLGSYVASIWRRLERFPSSGASTNAPGFQYGLTWSRRCWKRWGRTATSHAGVAGSR